VLVAADPEWISSGALSRVSVDGVRALSEAGADNLRLLDFNIFPLMSCAQVVEGTWNFTLMDQVVVPFLTAASANNATRTIVDIETSPQWMWTDAGACVLLGGSASDPSCASTHGQPSNATCADATGTALPPGPRTRCPHWGDTRVPRDRSWRELASYFARVAMWYTRGGFWDEQGRWHGGGHLFDETKMLWEVWNEISHSREHGMTLADYIAMYDAHVAALTTQLDQGRPPAAVAPGGAWRGQIGGPSKSGMNDKTVNEFLGALLNASQHTPSSTRVDAVTFHQVLVRTMSLLQHRFVLVLMTVTMVTGATLRLVPTVRHVRRADAGRARADLPENDAGAGAAAAVAEMARPGAPRHPRCALCSCTAHGIELIELIVTPCCPLPS
jgi:hypothetical protein